MLYCGHDNRQVEGYTHKELELQHVTTTFFILVTQTCCRYEQSKAISWLLFARKLTNFICMDTHNDKQQQQQQQGNHFTLDSFFYERASIKPDSRINTNVKPETCKLAC